MKKKQNKEFVVWEGAQRHLFTSVKRAHALYLKLSRRGTPSSLYVQGMCAATANGSGDRIDVAARNYLSDLLEGGSWRDLSVATKLELKEFLLGEGHLNGSSRVYYVDTGELPESISREMEALFGRTETSNNGSSYWELSRHELTLSGVLTLDEIDSIFR